MVERNPQLHKRKTNVHTNPVLQMENTGAQPAGANVNHMTVEPIRTEF